METLRELPGAVVIGAEAALNFGAGALGGALVIGAVAAVAVLAVSLLRDVRDFCRWLWKRRRR